MFKRSILFFVLLVISSSAFAASTIYGPSGLIEVPTAEALMYKEFNLSVDYLIPDKQGIDEQYFYKVNIGTFKGWELGIVGGSVPSEGVYVNVKYYLMSDNTRFPLSIAIGGERLSSRLNTKAYLVASKKFEGGLNFHFGFRADFTEEDVDASLMSGVEYFLNNQFSLIGDLTGEKDVYTGNIGVRFHIDNGFLVRAAVLDALNSEGQGQVYTFGFSFSKFL